MVDENLHLDFALTFAFSRFTRVNEHKGIRQFAFALRQLHARVLLYLRLRRSSKPAFCLSPGGKAVV